MNDSDITQRFLRMGLLTLGALYFLILVGGIVRASGAGMGCPDWPTCFGRLIPPTEESQLPANYHELYVGYGDTQFNALKTWTEYVNRLVGAIIGLLSLLTLYFSWPFLKRERQEKPIFHLSLSVVLLIGFQAWLGSRVVASDLKPVMITVHMVAAFLIVCLLIYTLARSQRALLENLDVGALPARVRTVLWVAMGMTLLQIAMGTQIRESVDAITNAAAPLERGSWREHFPLIFYVHRSFSAFILAVNLWLAWRLTRSLAVGHLLRGFAFVLGGLVVAAILSGVSLDRLGFPAFVQPVHLLLANLIFGTQFFLATALRYGERGRVGR